MSGNKLIGRGCLILAITIFAASNSISSKLAEIGMQNQVDGRNPISFCNVLFVGNLCALIALTVVYGRKWNPRCLNRLTLLDWIILIVIAILAGAIAPSLTFFALEKTSATNVILVSRIQSPITLALFALAGRKANWWIFTGEIVAAAGILIMLLLQTPEQDFTQIMGRKVDVGELMAVAGAIALSVAKVTRGLKLEQIPLGVWAIFRTAVGTIAFAALVLQLFDLSHFADVLNPLVWQWVSVYGIMIVAGGQILWFKGLESNMFQAISYAGYIIPIAGIAIAYFILGEVPTTAQYIGMSIILLGAVLNQIGGSKSKYDQEADSNSDAERMTQFQGI